MSPSRTNRVGKGFAKLLEQKSETASVKSDSGPESESDYLRYAETFRNSFRDTSLQLPSLMPQKFELKLKGKFAIQRADISPMDSTRQADIDKKVEKEVKKAFKIRVFDDLQKKKIKLIRAKASSVMSNSTRPNFSIDNKKRGLKRGQDSSNHLNPVMIDSQTTFNN